jgi:hypothetical protein
MVEGLVSVIMPSWNTGRFIAESIKYVINQTYQNWELLIVDDCSSDDTNEIVASFKDHRIKYFKLRRKLKSHFDLFHMCDEKSVPIALWYACWNMFFGILKKKLYEGRSAI